MSCDWAEKISLLIDGELPPAEARAAEAHLDACAGCRRTKEDFLTLREAVSSYPLSADPAAERRALARILAAGAQTTAAAGPAPSPGRTPWREVFALPRLTPALASALAVAVLAVALGVVWSVGRRESEGPSVAESRPTGGARQDARQGAQATTGGGHAGREGPGAGHTDEKRADERRADGRRAEERRVEAAAASRGGAVASSRGRVGRRTPPAAGVRESVARVDVRRAEERGAGRGSAEDVLAEFRPLFVAAGGPADEGAASAAEGEAAGAGPQGDTARHFEQAQILLRTIRNARPGERPAAIADERRRSQKLLYRNIVLRREAARAGNSPVERALDSLEPLLIDIANLPDAPGRQEVSVIQERMRRKNIVAVLQEANIAALPRPY